jgi:hypothetical protein
MSSSERFDFPQQAVDGSPWLEAATSPLLFARASPGC